MSATPCPGNSAPTETTTIRAGADIALTVARPAAVSSGSVINYTYTALNNGPNAATNVVVQIAIPADLTSITPPPGCVVAGSNYNCTIARPITINTTAASPGNPANSTTISATGPADINLGNNTATDGGATITDQTYYGGKFGGKYGGLGEQLGPEEGLPNVRLIAPNGFAVSTDRVGRFSIPCAALPADIGSNFMLKLDTRTLPQGYRLSTENPRVVRVTPGMLTKMNFGVSRSEVVKTDLNSSAFVDGKPRPELVAGIAAKPSMLRLTDVLADGEDKSAGRKHLRTVEKLLRRLWPANGKYQLNIETVIQRVVAGAVNE